MATTKRTKLLNEATRSRAAVARKPRVRKAPKTHPRTIALAVSAALLPWGTAYALPTGEQVVHGAVSVARPTAQTMQITQGTQKGIVNWQGFSIGASEHVNVTQPSVSSVLLNRVLGNNPSEIFGRLTANGQVFLTNPNGVFFAPGASVDVGGLFASTLSIADQDFLAGRYLFSNAGNAGSVVNQGSIVTANGYTALVGPQVRNDGIIVARAGSVALAAGDRVSLDLLGDGLISLSVDQAAFNASVINTGRIEADGGTVLLAARSANALFDTVINSSGLIRANSLVERNGEIVLDGGSAGVVQVTGTLEATGADSGTTGGTVKVLGNYVGLFDNATINASGDAGGGTVLVGGNFQGNGPEANASQTIVAKDATIRADAITGGNGGKVIVWSDDGTQFYGSISARGGAQAGDGGFVEVSGKHGLLFRGTVDTSAPNGQAGTLLLDPDDATIMHATTAGNDVNATGSPNFVALAPALDWTLTDFSINTAMFTNSVTVTAQSITVDNTGVALGPSNAPDGSPNALNANTLTFSATNALVNHVTYTGSTWSYTNTGRFTINSGAGAITGTGGLLTVNSSGGLELISGTTINVVTAADVLAAVAPGAVTISNTAPSGTLTVTTVGATSGIQTTNSAISLTEQGSLTVNQAIDAGTNTVGISFGQANGGSTFTLGATGALTGGTKTVTGGNGNDTFNFTAAPGTTATLDGGLGTDTLQGRNAANSWSITAANGGSVTSTGTLTFTSVENLTGGTADDTFIFNAAGTLAGTLDGGTGTDTLNIAAKAGANTIDLQAVTVSGGFVGTIVSLESFTGDNAADVLVGTNANTTWTITGANDGTLSTGFSFTDIPNVTGGTLDDSFVFNAAGSLGSIDGGTGANSINIAAVVGANTINLQAGTISGVLGTTFTNVTSFTGDNAADVLVGTNANTTWTITGANDGTLSTGQSFTDIPNLTGGTLDDTFTFTTGSLTGSIDGGTGANSINIAAVVGANTIDLQAGTISGVLGGTFTNVTSFTGDNAADVLVGTNANTTWTISGVNDGTLSTGQTFTDIPNLTGGTLDDTFTFTTGSLTGSIVGGTGTDTINIAALGGANTIDLQAGTISGGQLGGTFTGVESFVGDNAADVLVGTNANTTWTITGANDGTLSTGQSFTDIPNLTGGTLDDTFTLTTGSLTGAVNGSGGNNTLAGSTTYSVTGANSGTAAGVTGGFSNIQNLAGTGGDDSFTLAGGTLTGTVDGLGGTDTLVGSTTYVINAANGGTATGTGGFLNVENLTGTAGVDTFTLNVGGSIGTLDGLGNTDTLSGSTGYTITGANTGSATGVTSFTGIENLTGTAGADTFTLAGGSIGVISGLGGGDTLAGSTSYTITGANAGSAAGVTSFTGIATLSGTGGNDTFTLASGVTTFAGTVQGLAGTDTLAATDGANTWVYTGTNAGTLNTTTIFNTMENLTGGSGGDTLSGTTAGGSVNMTDPTGLSVGTLNAGAGTVNLTAGSLGGAGTVTATNGLFSSGTNVIGMQVIFSGNLHHTGAATLYNYATGSSAAPFSVQTGAISIQINGVTVIASIGQQQAQNIIGQVSESIGAVIVEEANKTFGTDSVAEDVEYGFAGEIGATPPMDHRIDESGISLPACVQESREGVPCK